MIEKFHGAALLLASALVAQALPAECDPSPTPPPDPTPTETAPPVPTPVPCDDGFGLCERVPNTTCLIDAFAEAPAEVELERAFPNLSFNLPVFLTHAPDGSDRIFVLEKAGLVKVFQKSEGVSTTSVFMDIQDRVSSSASEMGLLGLAFHPDFAQNGYVYVDYTAGTPKRTRISRFQTVAGSTSLIDAASEEILLEVSQPFGNHNGGMLTFGPDGYLYVGFGDGGGAGDPTSSGQDPSNLLATIIRIDVDARAPGLNYGWPADNPFAEGGAGRPEVYAWGVRNPWRFSFDRLLGTLWLGDVGQDLYEEVDVVAGPGNYGWNTMEGFHCYSPSTGCDTTGLILPVIEYPHSEGRSITGGYVYRGSALPELYGRYIYGDYVNGRIWAARWNGTAVTQNEELLDSPYAITSFGEDRDGEVYVVAFTGEIFRFRRGAGGEASGTFPTRLSDTGCFADVRSGIPAPGVIPYGVNSPLWSDGDAKARWFAVPGTDTVGFTQTGAWDWPDGTVLLKEFATYDDARDPATKRRLETRLYVHLDGEWRGYTYKWNEAQTDALLMDGALEETLDLIDAQGQPTSYTHYYPSRADCQSCHTEAAGFSLGLETAQMNGDFTYPGGVVDNQLRALDHIGLFDGAVGDPAAHPSLATPGAPAAPLTDQARAYLHANCAHCHMPGGTAVANIDLRYDTALGDTEACGALPGQGDLGVEGALILAPGDPGLSTLSLRMHTLGEGRMPSVASGVVDPLGTSVVDGWISELSACP